MQNVSELEGSKVKLTELGNGHKVKGQNIKHGSELEPGNEHKVKGQNTQHVSELHFQSEYYSIKTI